MDASLLKDEIEIFYPVEARDEIGGTIETWSSFGTVYAYARSVRSADRYTAGRNIAVEAYEFVIRWIDGIDPKMRITYRGKDFRVTGLEPYDDRCWIKIIAEVYEGGEVV